MALVIGTVAAESGMSLAIFEQIDALLAPPLQEALDAAPDAAKPHAKAALDGARDGWRKLSFAIAAGVVSYLLSNLELRGIETRGDVTAKVSGTTATQTDFLASQSNDGTGLVH
jgi:hypothetical protein